MNFDKRTVILTTLSIVAIALASVATTVTLLPKNTSATLPAECTLNTTNIAKNATQIPPPIARTTSGKVTVNLEVKELCAEVEPTVSYQYWTFNGTVPGPMIRVLVGDNVTIVLKNDGVMVHSIDLHAVVGPGGGSGLTQTSPGQTSTFWFKALHPGLYVYHCATPPADEHIANGMYGMILVEPQGGLPRVDREFYIMQGEFYTVGDKGQAGHHGFDSAEMLTGIPDYVLFNGRVGALQGSGRLNAQVGQKVRIFFGVGGPNVDSSFHVIGEIFDRVYKEASFNSTLVATNVQTTLVPVGGATVVEFSVPVAGSFTLVDHSLTWAIEKGALGTLNVNGTSTPGIFQ